MKSWEFSVSYAEIWVMQRTSARSIMQWSMMIEEGSGRQKSKRNREDRGKIVLVLHLKKKLLPYKVKEIHTKQ
jgi:hypothetical protein